MDILEGAISILVSIGLLWGTVRGARLLFRKPHLTETLDYRINATYRAQVDAYLANQEQASAKAVPGSPSFLERVLLAYGRIQELRAQQKVMSQQQTQQPQLLLQEAVQQQQPALKEGSFASLKAIQSSDPERYLDLLLRVIATLYLAGVETYFSRKTLVDAKILTQSEWDFWIGPEVAGQKQPGIFRQIDALLVGNCFMATQQECTWYTLLGYLLSHGTIEGVPEAVRKLNPKLVEQWLDGDPTLQEHIISVHPDENQDDET